MLHTGEKSHKCYQCLPCVHTPCFKMHLRMHIGEMSFICSQRNCTCIWVSDLHTHMLTHIEMRALDCDQCLKYSHAKPILNHFQFYMHTEFTSLIIMSRGLIIIRDYIMYFVRPRTSNIMWEKHCLFCLNMGCFDRCFLYTSDAMF